MFTFAPRWANIPHALVNMKHYMMVLSNGMTQKTRCHCDADAMIESRHTLETMAKIAPVKRVDLYQVQSAGKYRYVVSYQNS